MDLLVLTEKQLKNFWKKVEIKSENECWNWTASLMTSGYGQFGLNGKMVSAHRLSWILANNCNFSSDKPYCLHSCHNPSCVNPKHLRAGSPQDNMNDKVKDGSKTAFGSGTNVSFNKQRQKWQAQIRFAPGEKQQYLGSFETQEESLQVIEYYKEKANKLLLYLPKNVSASGDIETNK